MDLNPFGDTPVGQVTSPSSSAPAPQPSPFGDSPITSLRPQPSAEDNIIAAQDTSPDEMAKAYELGRQTGLAPSLVQLDPQRVQADVDRRTGLNVVQKNPVINSWIGQDPNNAKLSRDDLTTLDRTVSILQQFGKFSPIRNAHWYFTDVKDFFLHGLDSTFDLGRSRPMEDDKLRDEMVDFLSTTKDVFGNQLTKEQAKAAATREIQTLKRQRAVQGLLFGPIEIGISPLLGAYRSFISRPIEEETGIPKELTETAAQLGAAVAGLKTIRDIPASVRTPEIISPSGLTTGPRPLEPKPSPLIDLGRGEYSEVGTPKEEMPPPQPSTELALREGEVPRPGTDWVVDQVHMEHAAEDRAVFDRAFEAAQESKLREREPNSFEELLRHSVGDRSIYIPSEAIEALYRDKQPIAGDKLLGWDGQAEQKVAESLALGTDLQVSMAAAIAHMDPAVYSQIKDLIKFHDVAVSAEEAKLLKGLSHEEYPADLFKLQSIKEQEEKGEKVPEQEKPSELVSQDEDIFLPMSLPPVKRGFVRFYHGGQDPIIGGARWLTPDYTYARNYRGGPNPVHYVDIPEDYPLLSKSFDDTGTSQKAPFISFEAPEDIAKQLKPVPEQSTLSTDEKSRVGAAKRERKALYLDPLFKDAKSAGMDNVQFGRYSRKIQQADQEAYEKALAKAQALVKRRLAPEWKADREIMRAEVESDFKSTPMVVADRYLRLGELPTGEIVERQKLDGEAVAKLGGKDLDRYTVKRNGVHPDDIAPILQFQNGKELVDALNAFEAGRQGWDSEKGPRAYLDHLIDKETDERMERRYGSLQGNILDEARDLVTTASHLDILTDELKALANLAELPFERDIIKTNVSDIFTRSVAQEVSYELYRRGAEKQAKVAEKHLLAGKFREAFQAKLRQFTNVLMAKEAKAFEKKRATAERNWRKIVRKDSKGGVEQDYYDNAKMILKDVGFTQKEGQAPLKSLTQLINDSGGQVAVAAWLTDPSNQRQGLGYANLTVEEFNALNDSIRSLIHVGGEVKTILSVHGRADLDNLIFDVRKELERFGLRPTWERQSYVRRVGSMFNYVSAAHTLVERLFDYTDKFDPNGPITRFVDRPLRDSYAKELELTEQVVSRLRKLEQYTDPSVNDYINNRYIVDPLDKSFFPMTRKNLRIFMLHLGSDSGIKKLTEGFGIDLISAFNLVRTNAHPEDFAWVNGMHEIFDFLWKPASEMQRRYTGVEADKIDSRPFEMKLKDGTVVNSNGGYAPIFYDKTRTNIEGDLSIKSDLFDKNYVAAIPAHGYTMPRTNYKGWIDLNGTLMASRIYQMVHDISFREAVRNAQKVISDKEFMLAMNQYWGPQYASLLHGWLRDIANIHNVDDAFAQHFSRFLATMRQNLVNTLIAFNPGTVIKHGITALGMSVAQLTTGQFASAMKDLGLTAIAQAAKDLMTRNKVALTPQERANILSVLKDPSTREFIINSSALFRNRSRSYPDSIRGAYERASEAGVLQTVRNAQVISDRAGRFAVALSDMTTAMPTWLGAYKDALTRTGDHADAVFEADRVTTRAHGSSFYGDKTAIMRLGNSASEQLAKYFVSLFNFWNHMGNNLIQLAWDAEARARRGAGSEPGATLPFIMERVFLYGVLAIAVEELASPALSDEKDSLGKRMLYATLRYFGSFIPGIRDVTNAVFNGYEPSVGLLGTAMKTLWQTGQDIKKGSRSWITHTMSTLGIFGVPFASQQAGRTAQGVEKLATGQERPRNLEEYRALFRKGYIRPRR